MSTLELVAFGTLWVVFAALAVLVLLLYRQVERAYMEAAAPQPAPLPTGVEAPDIEVLAPAAPGGMASLPFSPEAQPSLLVFVNTSCSACEELLRVLVDGSAFPGPVTVAVSGEGYYEFRDRQDERFSIFWLAHPADASHLYGVTIVPFVYAVRGKTILNAGVARSSRDVAEIVDAARGTDEELTASPQESLVARAGANEGVGR